MKKLWRFKFNECHQYEHLDFAEVQFVNNWICITEGRITIQSGYAWDGYTPKFHVFGLITIGTPDEAQHLGKPWMWEASLIHDALCQFRHELPFTKEQVTSMLYNIMC